MKGGIILDNWQLPIFCKRLDEAGYKYEGPIPMTINTSLLKVETDFVHKLQKGVEACQAECDSTMRGERCARIRYYFPARWSGQS